MARFAYKAINADGSIVRGVISADSEAGVGLQLGEIGLELIRCKPSRTFAGFGRGKPTTRRDQIQFYFQLEQMSRAGLPILETLADLRDSTENPRFQEVLSAMHESLEGGKTLSQAMAEHPTTFDPLPIQAVRVGETSGKLDEVLARVTESMKWIDELAAQVKKALMYPAFVGVVVIGALFFMMIFVVPEMVSFIESMGSELPIHTRVLIAVSEAVTHWWYLFIGVPVATGVGLTVGARRSPRVRYLLDAALLRLWLIGPIMRKIALSRFAGYFSLLHSSGIDVIGCLDISRSVVGNAVIAKALEQAGRDVAEGSSIAASLKRLGLFPPLVTRMIQVGESTGRLDEALDNVSYFYDREVREGVERLQTMIEPVMTAVLGGIIAWVMLSVLGPIYDSMGSIDA